MAPQKTRGTGFLDRINRMYRILPAVKECNLVEEEDVTHKSEHSVVRMSWISGQVVNCTKDKPATGN